MSTPQDTSALPAQAPGGLSDEQIEAAYRRKHDLQPDDTTTFFGHYLDGYRDALRSAGAAQAPAQPVEPEVALWQFRWTNPGGDPHPTSKQLAWQEVTPWGWTQTLEQRIDELRAFKYDGKAAYKVRALYAVPFAPQPAEPVRAALKVTDAMVEALLSFQSRGSYLSHPEVSWRGTDNGDTAEAWNRRFAKASLTAALASQGAARHATNEFGDCPHWCKACAAEANERASQGADSAATAELVSVRRAAIEVFYKKLDDPRRKTNPEEPEAFWLEQAVYGAIESAIDSIASHVASLPTPEPAQEPSEPPAIAAWRQAETERIAATDAYNVAHRAALDKEAERGFGFADLTREFGVMTEASNKAHKLRQPALDALYLSTAPLAVERKALTDEQVRAKWEDTFSTNNPFCPCNLKSFTKAARAIERAHGIGTQPAKT